MGVAYGGGFLFSAASQSNGVDADFEGLVTGERGYTIFVPRGVVGPGRPLMGVRGEAVSPNGEDDADVAALLVWASLRRDMVVPAQAVQLKRPDHSDTTVPLKSARCAHWALSRRDLKVACHVTQQYISHLRGRLG